MRVFFLIFILFWVGAFPLWGLDLNRATVEELEALPGIGPALARRIVEYRERYGPFQRLEDLLEIKGIGPKRLEALRGLVTVGSEERVAQAEGGGEVIYQWVDDRGVVHFTQFPEEIPAKYRSRVKIFRPKAGSGTQEIDREEDLRGEKAEAPQDRPSRRTDMLGRDLRWYMKEKERLVNRIRRLRAQIEENKQVMKALRGAAPQARRGIRTEYGLKLGEGPLLRRWAEYKRLRRINEKLEKELAELEYRLEKGLYKEALRTYAPPEVLEFLKKDP